MCETKGKKDFNMRESTCTWYIIMFVDFKYFGIARNTQIFNFLIITCKGQSDSSMCVYYKQLINFTKFNQNLIR